MERMARRMQGLGASIFAEMTALANAHNALNLGQGFPDFAAPDWLKEAAREAIADDINQYAPSTGRPRLRQALAMTLEQQYGLGVNPETELVVTHGATEGIFAAILGVVNPGDEVIIFEPFYDSYVPAVEIAGGVPHFYTLEPPAWEIDPEKLAALFSPRTRLIIVNTPHNPTGKVYSPAELDTIAQLCVQHSVLALSDEVYEHITFGAARHVPLMTRPGMRERTLTISSLGKTFSVTGWKVGWVAAAPDLCQAVFRGHQFMTFSGAAPLQEAAAVALESAPEVDYYAWLRAMYERKRDSLVEALESAGLRPITPDGTYFVMARIDHLGFADDRAFCRFLTTELSVAAIPPSAFYRTPGGGETMARFAFCKTDEVLDAAALRLKKLPSA